MYKMSDKDPRAVQKWQTIKRVGVWDLRLSQDVLG